MLNTAIVSNAKPRRTRKVRPRLGNTWQDQSWRGRVSMPVPSAPPAKLPVASKRPRKARSRSAVIE
ncbi:hypothetical protein [Hyphomicrobium sp. CS1BSMeth3]|uniref:hypothetical protein n=1 Tax=Hyphomicrobium sp. CS1BSMeth3 TaxID=1892844 RepID=UPI0009302157|nr:hypothetical protein [Hyphomicrobium sp. CS1BSMeth3]